MLGYLNMPKEKEHQNSDDFKNWAEQYLKPNIKLKKCQPKSEVL